MAGLSPTAKLLIGSLMVIIALGLFLVAQWSSTTTTVPFAVTPAAYDQAMTFLAARGVKYEEEGGRIMVPAERHGELLAGFAEQGGGSEAGIDFTKLVELDSPFETTRQSETKKLIALQNVLGRTISGFRNVKAATVFISPKPATPLGASRHVQTASVHVQMRQGGLTQDQVDSIASMVAGTQAGLRPENVSVTDGAQSYRTTFGRGAAAGENLEHSLKIADAVQARIATLLASINGVRIAVNPQVVTTERTRTKTEFRDGISIPVSESTQTSETKSATASREPGTVPNAGMALGGGANGGQTSTERAENRYLSQIPGTRETEIDPTGYAVKIDVGVAMPWSYFVRVWRLRNPSEGGEGGEGAAKEPDEAAIAAVRDEEIARIKKLAASLDGSGEDAVEAVIAECEGMLAADIANNRAIGSFGADALCAAVGKPANVPIRVLTHCNTGSIATAGFGTALGVVRALRETNRLEHIYCNETRPYNQGARLTAYEIAFEKMPGTLICDSAAAALMAKGKVDAVVVGADRVADNGDTANKIGTYNLAVSAKYHDVPFFVAAPLSTLDPSTGKGADIVIEDRPASEITHVLGKRVAADGIDVWNPSFDVTPAALIAGIITEKGVVAKTAGGEFAVGKFVAAASG